MIKFFTIFEKDDLKPVSFDSRIIPLSYIGTVDYFKNRQNEAWRNCLNGYSYWKLRENYDKIKSVEILNRKKSNELHNLLFENGLNINDVPVWQRRGIGLYKTKLEVNGYNPMNNVHVKSDRNRLKIDHALPLINKDFFKNKSILTGSDNI